MNGRGLNVMVVDDNPADAKLTVKLLSQCEQIDPEGILVAESGDEAIELLSRCARGSERRPGAVPPPSLLFLDLNIPNVNGFDVLAWVRASATFQALPVIILSSSAAPRDVRRAYAEKATAYLRKPVDLSEFRKLVSVVADYWFDACQLPGVSSS